MLLFALLSVVSVTLPSQTRPSVDFTGWSKT